MRDMRLAALRRFATAITVLNVVGRAWLGFEQSWLQWLVALGTAYAVELGLELVHAGAHRHRPRFAGGLLPLVNFLLPAHISGQAVSMLMFFNEHLWPVAFATAVAISSKWIFRAPVGRGRRHFLNPSNMGIAVTLLLFPWIGIAPPYHFLENVSGRLDWILPAILVTVGTFLNLRFTGRIPLILGWLGGFAAQAVIRAALHGTAVLPPLNPMTGIAFLLFTFYMVSDPGTTPSAKGRQVLFGISVAAMYGILTAMHAVFGLFFALAIVCIGRGIGLYVMAALVKDAAMEGEATASRILPSPAPAALAATAGGGSTRAKLDREVRS